MADGAVNRRDKTQSPLAASGNNHGNGAVSPNSSSSLRLRLNPNTEHVPENYIDMQLDFNPLLYRSLESHLPPTMLSAHRDTKAYYMRHLLMRYAPDHERHIAKKNKEYRDIILSSYQPKHQELYHMQPTSFFLPSFLKAIGENTEEAFRNIISEPSPGVLTFEMLQPHFCDMLLDEVDNFEHWIRDTKFRVMRPNTMNSYGAVLDDFGLASMLDKLMEDFIRPMAKIFFPEVGGGTLDSHHGFVVEYGPHRDADLGFHVDDSEVTLNVCLGKQFSGGELFFRGVRCDKHVNVESKPEEIFDYSHVPGRAVIHRGRHRHGARSTTSGHRVNMLLWCKSSVFREMRKYEKHSPSWCGECQREKKERQRHAIAAINMELLKKAGAAS